MIEDERFEELIATAKIGQNKALIKKLKHQIIELEEENKALAKSNKQYLEHNMVEVIKKGKREVTCDNCESLLGYTKQDIQTEMVHRNESESYIVCPVCEHRVRL